jgi:short-chain Z-isoprenyl diphosphate synthase
MNPTASPASVAAAPTGWRRRLDTLAAGLGLGLGLLRNVVLAPFYALYRRHLEAEAASWSIPRHIGIIMDGNRRFARNRHLLRITDGHERGADKLEEVLNWCEEVGVEVVTVWIFSLDNFKRDPAEVGMLMQLFERKFLELVTHPRIHRNQIRVRTLGKLEVLPDSVRQAIRDAEAATCHYTRRVLNIGVAYGGREEIIDAFSCYLRDQAAQGHSAAEIADALEPGCIAPYLYTSELPDPDLIIRTSGEVRLSGFLLWQSVYSEFYFCDTFWPAFRKIDFLRALRDYHQRQRRFGR